MAGLGALLALSSGCSTGSERKASEVDVVAVEYAFRHVPSHLPTGRTTFVVRNEGGEGHDFILTRVVDDEVRIPDVIELPQLERRRFLEPAARTVIVLPGDVIRLPVDLREGKYAYLYLTTTEAGRTHAYHGMWGNFSVGS